MSLRPGLLQAVEKIAPLFFQVSPGDNRGGGFGHDRHLAMPACYDRGLRLLLKDNNRQGPFEEHRCKKKCIISRNTVARKLSSGLIVLLRKKFCLMLWGGEVI